MMKLGKLFGLVAMVATMGAGLSACNGGGGGSISVTTGGSAISTAWYNVYGQYCGSLGPGCDFYWNGDQIIYGEDPYYASLVYGTYYYYDVYGYYSTYTGWARQSASGIIYDEFGYALNSKEKHGRDVVTNAAAAQKAAVNGAAQMLQAKYGLNADVARNIATSLNDWALIGKSRKRTEADVAAFSKRLAGLDIGEVNAALEAAAKGDTGAVDQTIEKAAAAWSTNPDTMKQILTDWFVRQNAGSNQ
jgi:hypothetical protein